MRFLCVFFVFFGVCHMDCGAMTTGRCLYSRHRVGVSMVRLVCLPIYPSYNGLRLNALAPFSQKVLNGQPIDTG